MPTRYNVTLSRDNMLLLRAMAMSSTTENAFNILKALGDEEDPERELALVRRLATQAQLQCAVHEQIFSVLTAMVKNAAISVEMQLSQNCHAWLKNVSRLARLDPDAPTMAAEALKKNLSEDYRLQVESLRAALEGAAEVEVGTEPEEAVNVKKPAKEFVQ